MNNEELHYLLSRINEPGWANDWQKHRLCELGFIVYIDKDEFDLTDHGQNKLDELEHLAMLSRHGLA